jgi:hypothetical protein
MRRFSAGESRWRAWLPEDASSGAVPFGEANRSRLANRWMSPVPASSRAAPKGPDAVQVLQGRSAGGDQFGEFLVQSPGFPVDGLELASQLGGEPAASLADLPGGQDLLGAAGH